MRFVFDHPFSLFHSPPSMKDPHLTYGTLCRMLSGQDDAALTSTLGPDDWRLLSTTARREGVAPVLYHALNDAGWPGEVPLDVQADLRRAYYATTAANLLVYRELSRILGAFSGPSPTVRPSEQGSGPEHHVTSTPQDPCTPAPQHLSTPAQIPVIVLKGAALAATIYPSIGLRPLGDLDLLVPKDRLVEAVARLKALGYIEPYPEMAPSINALASHHVHFQGGRDLHLAIELHWTFHWTLVGSKRDWRSPSIPWFWTQTEAWKREGGRGKLEGEKGSPSSIFHPPPSSFQLTPTAQLLYLCAHLMLQHPEAHSVLRWFYDIYLLVEREGQRIQWDEVMARAGEFRWAPAVYAALESARHRFCGSLAGQCDAWLPPGVLEALAEASDLQASQFVARPADRLQTRAMSVVATAWALAPRARLRLLLAITIPSPAYVRWRYKPRPVWLWPLCYPYRWLDILREALTSLWQMANSE